MDLRGDLHLGMHPGVCNPRRNHVAPGKAIIGVGAGEDKGVGRGPSRLSGSRLKALLPARLPAAQQAGWNGLVVTLFLFLLQGLSVLTFSLTRLFSSGLMRLMLVVTSLLGPWAILLSLLGLFDQWFDFRSRFVGTETPAAP